MPAAYGTDKLEVGEPGSALLVAKVSKGWIGRKEKTATSAEHPGTAILWEDNYWEVVRVEPLGAGAVRYTLAPWRNEHVIRVSDAYDPDSEEERARQRKKTVALEGKRRRAIAFAFLAGHLPGGVQERMEREFNAPATTLSLLSTLPPLAFGGFCLVRLFAIRMVDLPLPFYVMVFGAWLFFQSLIRALLVMTQGRAFGSAEGIVAYTIWEAVSRGRGAPGAPAEPLRPGNYSKSVLGPPPAEQQQSDAYSLREPLFALLSAKEQMRLTERYGFDAIKWGRRSAIALAVLGGALAAAAAMYLAAGSGNFLDILVLFAGGYLVAEQMVRFRQLERLEPAPSALGFLVRPLARRFFMHS